jgi:predicted nuclease of predicted toxin-antitoxin system
MKFLIDQCAGRGLADWLRSNGHDSVYSAALGPDPGDLALLQRAVSEERILVTIDTDFGRLVYRGGEVQKTFAVSRRMCVRAIVLRSRLLFLSFVRKLGKQQ